MLNTKNNKVKSIKNLLLIYTSTTILISGAAVEAIGAAGGPPLPPPPPPSLPPPPPALGTLTNIPDHVALFQEIRTGKKLKKTDFNPQHIVTPQEQLINQNLARLKKTGTKFDNKGNFIITKKHIPATTNLPVKEMLEERQLKEDNKKVLEEQYKKLAENKKNAEAHSLAMAVQWADEARKTQEIVAEKEKENREIIKDIIREKFIRVSNESNTNNSHNQILINNLQKEKLALLKNIEALQEQLNNNSNNIDITTAVINDPSKQEEKIRLEKEMLLSLEANKDALLTEINALNEQVKYLQQNNTHNSGEKSNDSSMQEQEEIIRLKDKILIVETLLGEKQRNEEFLDIIELLKQYISEGGSIEETIDFLEEQRRKGLSLSEAIDFLEEKENMEAMLELQEQENVIDAKLEQIAEEKITGVEEILSATSSITNGMMSSVSDLIKNRISSVSGLAAVGAGDDDISITKCVWIAGLYGTNKQGTRKNIAGYKGNTYGNTIGFDVEFDDNDILGIAYTRMRSNFKASTSTKSKTAVNSHVLALYGQKELPQNFSVQAMFAAARNYIKNKSFYSGSNVVGKYTNDSLSFETLLNYKYPTNYELTIIPNIGIRYGSSKDGVYKDSELGVQHLTIAAKAQDLWTGIVGTKILFTSQKVAESVTLTPGLHGSIKNHFNNKNKKVEAQVSWEGRQIKETIALPKQPKTGYNIGASVLAEKGNINLLLEYNCHLQKKYQSHQGFVKLKINF